VARLDRTGGRLKSGKRRGETMPVGEWKDSTTWVAIVRQPRIPDPQNLPCCLKELGCIFQWPFTQSYELFSMSIVCVATLKLLDEITCCSRRQRRLVRGSLEAGGSWQTSAKLMTRIRVLRQ
jgi:hypothetical protein